jgi:hypothetical protein
MPALVLAWAWTNPAGAQTNTAAGILREWRSNQTAAWEVVERIAFTERTENLTKGPFGESQHLITARVFGNPESNSWRRDIRSVEQDGRPLNNRERERIEQRRDPMPGPPGERLLQSIVLAPRLLFRMQPVSPVQEEILNGVSVIRFDVAPEQGVRSSIERITLWFSPQNHALVRSLAVVHEGGPSYTLQITTDYQRQEELDVPVSRQTAGTIQMQRRLRTFTVVLNTRSDYSDFDFDR